MVVVAAVAPATFAQLLTSVGGRGVKAGNAGHGNSDARWTGRLQAGDLKCANAMRTTKVCFDFKISNTRSLDSYFSNQHRIYICR